MIAAPIADPTTAPATDPAEYLVDFATGSGVVIVPLVLAVGLWLVIELVGAGAAVDEGVVEIPPPEDIDVED